MINKIIVDNRLIHRTEIEKMCHVNDKTNIVIVTLEKNIDYIDRTRIERVLPEGCRVNFFDVNTFYELYKNNGLADEFLIVFREVKTVLNFIQIGGAVSRVEVRNLNAREDIRDKKFFNKGEENDLRDLVSKGIAVELSFFNTVEKIL